MNAVAVFAYLLPWLARLFRLLGHPHPQEPYCSPRWLLYQTHS